MATTGITVPLRPGPVRINLEVLGRAEGLPRAIRRKVRRFVRERDFTDWEDPPDFDYDEIMKLLPQAGNEARQVENVSGFRDPAMAMEYADALGSALGYITSIAPAELLPALVGGKAMRPGGLDLAEFRRRYSVVDRPLLALDDLCAGVLVPDQVEALAAVYPNLYGTIRQTVMEEMIAAAAAKVSFALPYVKDQILQILLQTDTLDARLHTELQKAFNGARERESGKPTGAPSTPQRKGIGDPSTQQERLEAK